MTDCGCRKGAVRAGCPRHSVFTSPTMGWVLERRHRGWWHRLLIRLERRRNGEAVQTNKERA